MKDLYIVKPTIDHNEIRCGDLRNIINRSGRENVYLKIILHNEGTEDISYDIMVKGRNGLLTRVSSCNCMLFKDLVLASNANRISIFTDNNFTNKLYAGGA